MQHSRALLTDLGHDVIDASLSVDWESFTRHVNVIWCVPTASAVTAVAQATGRVPSLDLLEAATLACYEAGLRMSALDVADALGFFNGVSRAIGRYFEGIDMLLSPVAAQPPPRHGVIDQNAPGIDALTWTQQTFERFPFTPLFNATGQPAISLPLYASSDGLPMGSQFVGRFGDEATLLMLAAQIERAHPWSERRPAILR